ncbi:MAG: acyltransferase [Erythrobacter sp.]|nr:acyltransferase [Erythrobacter sp.]
MTDRAQHSERIAAIQLLRGLAAVAVAVSHLAYGFADHIGDGLGLPPDRGRAAQVAVCVFFVISGHVMVVSSRRLEGRREAARRFWTRRCVRILPTWWIASLFTVAVLAWLGRAVDPVPFALSLFLVPHAAEGFAGRPVFLLWPGWTLFYEMVFYLLFGLSLAVGRARSPLSRRAVVAGGLIALGLVGEAVEPQGPFLVSLTRPVLLLFLAGVAIAEMREAGRALAPGMRWICAALAAATVALVPAPETVDALGFDYLAWAGLPAVFACLAAFGGPLRLPFFPLIDRFGDTSFALYLLHVPVAHVWIEAFPLRFGPWPFLLSAIGAALGVSLAFFLLVERPLTRRLNAAFGHAAKGDRMLERTSV